MTQDGRGPVAVDMSPAAIARRLRKLDELVRLGLSLRRARRLGPVEREAAPAPIPSDPKVFSE